MDDPSARNDVPRSRRTQPHRGARDDQKSHQLARRTSFDRRDVDNAEKTRVDSVNREFARHFFGDRGAADRHLSNGVGPKPKINIEIVGVVADSL